MSNLLYATVLYVTIHLHSINGFTPIPTPIIRQLSTTSSDLYHLPLLVSTDSNDVSSSSDKQLSKRAERKRVQRIQNETQRGQSSRRNPSRKEKGPSKDSRGDGKVYTLHSTAVSALTTSSTAQDVIRAIKRAQVSCIYIYIYILIKI